MCQLLGLQPGSQQQQHNPLQYDLTELAGVHSSLLAGRAHRNVAAHVLVYKLLHI
jgi:hypothetical protein